MQSTSMSGSISNETVPGPPNESTRLLSDEERDGRSGEASPQASDPGPVRTPLPKAQLGTLVAVRIVDPIAYTQIFPYINQLLADLHVAAPEQVGFYSGFIEGAYSFAQMISVYQWGRLSDSIGRRPVVLFCLVGIMATTIAFGCSTSLVTILASRFLAGLVSGTIAVLYSILAEITDDTNQNIAIPVYSLAFPTGTILGPLIGGTFAKAAARYPKYFSWSIFVNHPYLPPCIISAVCALLGTCLGYFYLEETLPRKQKGATGVLLGSTPPSSALDTDTSTSETEPPSVKALLAIPALRALTLSGLALSFLSSAFDAVFTLFCYTPVYVGGLGLEPSTIGNFLALAGTLAVLLRLIAMPYILHRFDYVVTYKTCMYLWPITFAFLPLFNVLARAHPLPHSETSTGTMTTPEVSMWIGLAAILGLSKVGAIPFSITVLLTKRYAPALSTPASNSGSALGKSHGLVQFAICLGRAVGPVVVSTLFTALNGSMWGVGPTWAVIMVGLALVGARVANQIR